MTQVELPAGFGQARGSEHEVWFSSDGRAIKATHPGEYGRLFGPDRFATLEQYLDRIRLTVDLFGLDRKIHGIHGAGRNARVVTSQPIFLGKPATRQQIAEFMKERRFVRHRTRFGDVWYRYEDNVLVADAEPKNVVHGVEGLALIDVIVCRPKAELLQKLGIT